MSTPVPGSSARIRRAARRPSSVSSGGIRMSTIATSGWWARTLRSSSSASPACADDLDRRPRSSSRATPSRSSTESSAITTRMGSPRGHGRARRRRGCRPSRRAAERGDAVGEPAQARAVRGVGAAEAVVGDLDHAGRRRCARTRDVDARVAWRSGRRWSAPRRRRSRRRPRPPGGGARPAASHRRRASRRAAASARSAGRSPPLGQHRRVDPAGELAQLGDRGQQLVDRLAERARRRRSGSASESAGQPPGSCRR